MAIEFLKKLYFTDFHFTLLHLFKKIKGYFCEHGVPVVIRELYLFHVVVCVFLSIECTVMVKMR